MFYNGEPLYMAVETFLMNHTGVPCCEMDDEVTLESLGIMDEDIEEFEQTVADHFGFELNAAEHNIGAMACVYHVTQFIEENL